MKNSIIISILLLFNLIVNSQTKILYPQQYVCHKITDSIKIDGILDETIWKNISKTAYFQDIEGPTKAKPTQNTWVKMCWDDSNLYIAAYLQEKDLWANFIYRESIIFQENDFEVFIDPNGDNHDYYEFEINALNTLWDLNLNKPYRDCGVPNSFWNCENFKSAVKVYGSINNPNDIDSCWTIEMTIPFSSMGGFPQSDSIWRVNFSRVQYDLKVENSQYVKKSKTEHNWTWTPQYEISLHKPELWGYVQFTSYQPNTKVKIKKDEYFDIKIQLMNHYKAQRTYHKSYDKYTSMEANLIYKNKDIKIYSANSGFISGITKNGKTWYVNQDGKLWMK